MMARVRKQLDLPTGSIGCGQLPGGDTGTSPAEEMKIKVMRDRVAEILQSKPIVVASTATFTLPESFYGTIVFEPRRGLNDRQAPS